MIFLAFILSVIISTGSFALGYQLASRPEAINWMIAFGLFWLLAEWRKWRWFSLPAVFVTLSLAAYGIWFKFIPGWMFNGAAFGLFASNLSDFQQRLHLLPMREDKQGMTRRHLIRVGVLAIGALLISFFLGISK